MDRKRTSDSTSLPTLRQENRTTNHRITPFLPLVLNDTLPKMAYPGFRLATLSALPASVPIYKIKLAQAGFYYQGNQDELVCYACNIRHAGWTSADNPIDVHRRLSPRCPHLQLLNGELSADDSRPTHAENVDTIFPQATYNGSFQEFSPQSSSETASSTLTELLDDGHNSSQSERELAASQYDGPRIERMMLSEPQASETSNENSASSPTRSSAQTRGASRVSNSRRVFPGSRLDLGGAVYPMYQDLTSRKRSFSNWNENSSPSVNELIQSGMFYAGYADTTRCFYCGVGLKSWNANDNVWHEHAKWRPSCEYVKAVKGDDFAQNVLEGYQQDADGQVVGQTTSPAAQSGIQTVVSNQQQYNNQGSYATAATETNSTTTTATNSTTPESLTNNTGENRIERLTVNGVNETQRSLPATNDDHDETERYQRALEENRELSSRLQCRICRNSPVDTIYLPCGHIISCDGCSSAQRICLLCQEVIRGTAKVYFN